MVDKGYLLQVVYGDSSRFISVLSLPLLPLPRAIRWLSVWGRGVDNTFTRCKFPAFSRREWGELRMLPASFYSQLPSAQNNSYTIVAHFEVTF